MEKIKATAKSHEQTQTVTKIDIPKITEEMADDNWDQCTINEYNSMIDTKIFHLVLCLRNKNVIKSKWLWKVKYDQHKNSATIKLVL